jgi:O-acetyl-ADP-ribose deacetylase (regulator of RNase III)
MNQVLRQNTFPTGRVLQIVKGDITQEEVDAIVNPANAKLQHLGGLAGLIVQQGGHIIQAESNSWVQEHGPVQHVQPAYTSAGRLPCQYIIHAVGPVWGEGNEDKKLSMAVSGTLKLADKLKLDSISIPAISTGIFGFPKQRAARIHLESIQIYLSDHHNSGLRLIRLILFDQASLDTFLHTWDTENSSK